MNVLWDGGVSARWHTLSLATSEQMQSSFDMIVLRIKFGGTLVRI
jgi:hypothetical protein